MTTRFLVIGVLLLCAPSWASPKRNAPKATPPPDSKLADAGNGFFFAKTPPLDAAFHHATALGDIAQMEALHNRGVSLEARNFWGVEYDGQGPPRDKEGTTPLFTALKRNQLEAARWLLERGADASAVAEEYSVFRGEIVNNQSSDDMTPLDLAVFRRQNSFVKLLLQHGATSPLPGQYDNERTPRVFLAAAVEGSLDTMQLLLDNYAPKQKAIHASDAIVSAAQGHEPKMVSLLLAEGADGKGCGAALIAAINDREFDIADLLVPHTDWHAISSVDFFGAIGREENGPEDPFFGATSQRKDLPKEWRDYFEGDYFEGYVEVASRSERDNRRLLALLRLGASKGANPNAFEEGRDTPLMGAIEGGNTDVVVALLDAGASAKASPPGQMAPLHYLAVAGQSTRNDAAARENSARKLPKRFVKTALYIAHHNREFITQQDIAIARALIQHGADLKVGDNRLALPAAKLNGNTALAAFFLQQGDDARVALPRLPVRGLGRRRVRPLP